MADRLDGLLHHVQDCQPGPVTSTDVLAADRAAALAAVLGQPAAPTPGTSLPPLWHWLYFTRWPSPARLGPDGHEAQGHFLPPIPQRRRMIAGGRVEIARPLVIDVAAQRVSTLGGVVAKTGSSGEMLFVTERHEISQDGSLCVVEELDVVYRSGEPAAKRDPIVSDVVNEPAANAPWVSRRRPDSVLLFRFSALTSNSHRIHYDQDYCRQVENYPDLVVHGPLLAILMLELVRAGDTAPVHRLTYRLRKPTFVGESLAVTGTPTGSDGCELQVSTARAEAAATASVEFR